MSVLMPLTDEQAALIAPYLDQAEASAQAGKPGMVVGQFTRSEMKVGFIPHEKAIKMAKRTNGKPVLMRDFEGTT